MAQLFDNEKDYSHIPLRLKVLHILELAKANLSFEFVADLLGSNPKELEDYLVCFDKYSSNESYRSLMERYWRMLNVEPEDVDLRKCKLDRHKFIKQKCIVCGEQFKAHSRFNKVCRFCKRRADREVLESDLNTVDIGSQRRSL